MFHLNFFIIKEVSMGLVYFLALQISSLFKICLFLCKLTIDNKIKRDWRCFYVHPLSKKLLENIKTKYI